MKRNNESGKSILTGAKMVGDEAVVYVLSADEGGNSFGIAALKLGADGDVTESAHFANVTTDRVEAERVFDLVLRGTVTPCVLGEVLEELICE